ncbi:MAG: polysaccharide biosynthesis tyrosine autokinase [Sphingomonadales bacterium]|nr:polysaccharide biosynthesis tyrosine autokinase [Sphingomonadales bacterium]
MNAPAQLERSIQPDAASFADGEDSSGLPTLQIDLRRIFAAFYRNRLFIAGIMLLALSLGMIATLTTTPIYRATASVQVDVQTENFINDSRNGESNPYAYDLDRFLQTNLDVLTSHSLALRVVNALNLAGNDDFFRRMSLNAPRSTEPGMTMADTRRKVIADVLQGNLESKLPRSSQVVEISFTSPDPAYATKIANSYAEQFIAANLQRKFDSSAYARTYLEDQLRIAKDRLEASERAQISYARDKGLIDVVTESSSGNDRTSTSLLLTTLVDANKALSDATSERVRAEERYRVAASGNVLAIPEVQNNSAIQQLLRERAVASAELSRDKERYGEDHPVMKQRRDQVADFDRQINRYANQVRDSLHQQYDTALRNERQLAGQVTGLRGKNQVEQGDRVQFNILSREASTNRTMYEGLLQRYKEVSASAGVATNNISMVDKADPPTSPIRPRPLRNLAIALLIGALASIIFVVLRDYYDDAIRTPDDVIKKLQIPFLGILPKLPVGVTAAEALDDPKSSVSEAFAALRTQMSLLSSDGVPRTMMVTSSRESEGKSMVAFGIARSFARLGKRVLVVDSDLRRPSQHRLFDTSRDVGLTNVLTRQIRWQDAVQKTDLAEVDFIPSGPLPPSVPELLSGGSYRQFIEDTNQAYDMVMIDAPPVLGLADAILLGHMINHVIYVIESGRPLRGRGLAAVRRLRAAGIRIDGTVLNKFDPKHTGYGYEYGYYYYYGKDDK